MKTLYSIIIPCYNEEKNIPLLLERFNKVVKKPDIEILLVNNGSTDNSQKIINQAINKYSFLKTASVPINRGYGFGILSGFKKAKGDFIGWTHADLQTDPNDVIKAIEIIKRQNFSKNIYVKGGRHDRPLFDVILTIFMGIFETLYLKKMLWDINAQPNIFHKSFLKLWQNPPHDFALDLYALFMAKKYGLQIYRFNVPFLKRIHGHSSWNTGFSSRWKFIKRTLDFSIKLKSSLT